MRTRGLRTSGEASGAGERWIWRRPERAVSVGHLAERVQRAARGERRMRITGGRIIAAAFVLAALALGLAGCRWNDHHPGRTEWRARRRARRPHAGAGVRRGAGRRPTGPPHRRRLAAGLARHRRVLARPAHRDHQPADPDGHRRHGTLHAADLRAGLTTVEATASWRRHWGHGRYDRHDDHRFPSERGSSTFSWEPAVDLATANRCDVLAPTKCLMPFPNDFFTVADTSTPTGRRVHFDPASMTANSSGVQIDPTEWNRNDGFSPGSMIVTYVPGLDLARSGAAPITDIGASLRPDQPIVLLDATTGERWPIFSELDSRDRPHRSPRAHHPPGEEPDRRPPLRRCAAEPARRERRDDRGRSWLQLLPRPHPDVRVGDRGPPSAPRARLRRARARRHRSAQPVPRLGLHGRKREEPLRAGCSTSATTPSPRLPAACPGSRSPRSRTTSTTRSSAGSPAPSPSRTTSRGREPRQCVQLRARIRSRRAADPQRRLHRRLHLQHSALGHDRRQRPGAPGPRWRVRPRPARWRRRGERRERARHGERAQLRLLRDEVGRLLRGRHRRRGADAPGRLEHAQGRRPHAAGLPQLPVPRAPAQGPARLRVGPRVPGRCRAHAGARRHGVLRRQQPGRDPRRRGDRGVHRVDARGARRARDELQHAAATQLGLPDVPGDPEPGVSRRARPHHRLPAAPDAVGPLRGGRLRGAHDRRPVSGDARAPGAHARRVRRPPGRERHRGDRGAHHRRADPAARVSPPVAARTSCRSGASSPMPEPAVDRLRDRLLGQREPGAAARQRRSDRARVRLTIPHGRPRATPAAQLQKSEFLRPDGAVVDTCAGAPCLSAP